MKQVNDKKSQYVKPDIKGIEFSLEDSIATSMDFGPSTICGEQTF